MLLAEAGSDWLWGSWRAEAVIRLLVAAGLGALIGLEREQHGRSAGLRTHLLVALGSAMAMIVSLHFGQVYAGSDPSIRVDPARVAYGVMAGVGFLGAGAIIQYGAGVRGLTTAASLWCSAAIGLGAGFGMFWIGLVATLIVLFALVVLDFAEHLIPVKASRKVSIVVPDVSEESLARYRDLLIQAGGRVVNVDLARDFAKGESVIAFRVSVRARHLPAVLNALRAGEPRITRLSVE